MALGLMFLYAGVRASVRLDASARAPGVAGERGVSCHCSMVYWSWIVRCGAVLAVLSRWLRVCGAMSD